MADKFITKDYLLEQFEGYDRSIASQKYATSDAVSNKVDKVTGKGLSTNDYDNTAKNIVDNVTTNLAGKVDTATLNSYYTKSQVDTIVATIGGGEFIAVSTLPTTDIKTNAIYLVPKSDPDSGDIKDEYINLDGTTSGWERIGSTDLDLSNYVQKSQTSGLLKNDGTVDSTTYAKLVNLALPFDTSESYSVGAYVSNNNKIYKCITAHSGAWDAQDFEEVSDAMNEISDISYLVSSKVDKVTGKGLSTNDYDATAKGKLDNLANIKSIGSGLNLNSSTGELTASGVSITIDSAMSSSSANPVQNQVITSALSDKVDKVNGKGLSTNDYDATAKGKLDDLANIKSIGSGLNLNTSTGELTATGTSITIDSAMSASSTNPVQNKVITSALDDKVDKNGTDSLMTANEHTKLSGIATGAEVNVQSDWNVSDSSSDAFIKNKPTLGTASSKNVASSGNASSTEVVMGNDTRLTDSRNAADVSAWAKASSKPSYTASEVGAIASTEKGANSGVATLDSSGKVPSSQLPSYVDDVLEYASQSGFPATGETGKIYVAKDTNKTYRWSGSAYVEISASLSLGETSSTAYAGNKGKTNADNIATIQGLIPSSATTSNKLATASDIPSLTNYVQKSNTAGLLKNDGTVNTIGDSLTTSGNALKVDTAFTEASTRANIATGETIPTILGKIKKYFTDLKAVAFTGSYNSLSNTPAITSPNLLDNPWFRINQRWFTSHTASDTGYTVDRWRDTSNLKTELSSNIITLTKSNTTSIGSFSQRILYSEVITPIVGKDVTLSVMLSDGTIYSDTATIPTLTSTLNTIIDTAIGDTDFNMQLSVASTNSTYVRFMSDVANATIKIKAVKLEVGSTSTLYMDVPPNYQQELIKCQRFFERVGGTHSQLVGSGFFLSSSGLIVYCKTAPKRIVPTVTFSGTAYCWDEWHTGSSGFQSTALINDCEPSKDGNNLLKFSVSDATDGNPCVVQFRDTTSYLDFSADL